MYTYIYVHTYPYTYMNFFYLQCDLVQYINTDTRDKECLSETIRPGLLSVMMSDLPQPTHWFKSKYTSGDILLLRLQTDHLCE
jgi:hypothetical protein